jgi:hypothetical protein
MELNGVRLSNKEFWAEDPPARLQQFKDVTKAFASIKLSAPVVSTYAVVLSQ